MLIILKKEGVEYARKRWNRSPGDGPHDRPGMGYCVRPVRGVRGRGCRPYGWGFTPYAEYGIPDSPSQEKERLAGMEKALTEQLAEIKRMQARLEDAQDQE